MRKRFLKHTSVFMAIAMSTSMAFANNIESISNVPATKEISLEDSIVVTNESEFRKAVSNAESGEVIFIEGEIVLNSTIHINKGITIKGNENSVIKGSGIYLNENMEETEHVVFDNIKFINANINTNGNGTGKFYANLTVNNCEFPETDFVAIQIFPGNKSNIKITNCVFNTKYATSETNKSKYFIQLQSVEKIDGEVNRQENVVIEIVGNTFNNTNRVNFPVATCDINYDNIIVGKNNIEGASETFNPYISMLNTGGHRIDNKIVVPNITAKKAVSINHDTHSFKNGECTGCGVENKEVINDSINDTFESMKEEVEIEINVSGTGESKEEAIAVEISDFEIKLEKDENESIDEYEKKLDKVVEDAAEKLLNELFDSEIDTIEEARVSTQTEENGDTYKVYELKVKKGSKVETRNTETDEDIYEYVKIRVKISGENEEQSIKLTDKLNNILKPIQENGGFTDIPENFWAKDVIEKFSAQGYINGMGDGTFRPNQNMTRAQFVKVVNKYFGFTKKATSLTFIDVNPQDSFYEEILIGIGQGYINGKSEEVFDPNGNITREEVAIILTNIKNNKDTNIDKLNGFVDGNETSAWATSSVEGAIEAGYLQGDVDKNGNKTIRPQDKISRAEALVMLSRVEK